MADNQISTTQTSFLGRGWGFPVSFQRGYNGAEMLSDEEDIRSSLHILLSTTIGERVMRPNFGTNIHNLIFDTLDLNTQTLIADGIRRAILLHEPRIKVENQDMAFDIDAESGRVELTVNYLVKATNSRANIVYPFYLNEGTNVSE